MNSDIDTASWEMSRRIADEIRHYGELSETAVIHHADMVARMFPSVPRGELIAIGRDKILEFNSDI